MRRSERETVDPAVRDRYDRVWPATRPDGGGRAEPGAPPAERDERLWTDLASFGDPWDGGAGPAAARPDGWVTGTDGWPAGSPGPWVGADGWPPGGPGPSAGAGGVKPRIGAQALAALSPGRRGVKALAVVAVVVALVAAFVAWRSQPHTVAVPTVSSSSPPPSVPPAADGGTPVTSPTPSAAMLVVAVEGRVRHPGLVRLPPGSRVADAITAAGGALPGTDLSFVNLARKVVDGELIVIGMTPPPGTQTGAAEPSGGPAPGGIVDLNTATAADLDTLPGIGPALAQRILDYRTQHGGFHSVDELRNVSGIGDAKFAEIKDLVTV